ncbi:diaminopimelate epimerase [Halospeciosus flavus]|uniref:Diaminopimelate epimerase n=1 Tax=Halospeciosus flavus TaxID=3032283 RepID=A0ABD5Z524_9EURY|nr:diaminopimelate epimerase [Halospeciosus flavus]
MIPYETYHGTGNDFAIVDAENHVPDRGAFAEQLCADIGVDGVLFLALEDKYSPPRAVMTLFQPDGGTAEMCGNGARCAARWVAERTGSDEVMLDTQAGTRRALVDGEEVTVEMGAVSFHPTRVPLAGDTELVEEVVGGYEVTAVNTGVPHAVAFVDDVDAVDVEEVAPAIRHDERFPEGTNVNFAEVDPDGEGFRQRTFERGVEGETDSCGTGAVAIAAVAARQGHVEHGESVTVSPPGGSLSVTVEEDGEATLTGPTAHEYADATEETPIRRIGHGD